MGASQTVYLDYAASAPVREQALAAERAYDAAAYAGANPNSLHTPGRLAAQALSGARKDIAACLGPVFRPQDIVFTSGGTESNNLALLGISEALRQADVRRGKVVISAIEHESVLECARELERLGFAVERIAATREGSIDLEALEKSVDEHVSLVSVMAANNETGAIQPIENASKIAHAHGAYFHTDAVQAFCRYPMDFSCVDAVSVTAHKLGGPVGVGALALRGRTPLHARALGGGQEQRRRSGTQDVRGALAFAAVAKHCHGAQDEAFSHTQALANAFFDALEQSGVPFSPLLGSSDAKRLPGIVNILLEGADAHSLVLKLDEAGFAVSSGSACASASVEASHVLLAMGVPPKEALGALRISFDERVGEDELRNLASALGNLYAARS